MSESSTTFKSLADWLRSHVIALDDEHGERSGGTRHEGSSPDMRRMYLRFGAMGVVMMAWMWGMYANRRWNIGVVAASVVLAAVATFLSQSQILVEDGNYMRGMIPHHSIAILTSKRAGISDVRVRELADEIIEAQHRAAPAAHRRGGDLVLHSAGRACGL